VDYAYTDAQTGGTINGRNEDIDNITEVGGYLYSTTRVTSKLDLVAALRVDKHSALTDLNWSPRAAVVFKPNDDQAIRFSYNRAFSTPSNNNLYLDIVAGQIPIIPGLVSYKVRALGVPDAGFAFRGYCGAGGVDNLCMRTPYPASIFPGTPTTAFPAQAAPLWPIASGLVAQGLLRPGALPPTLAPFAGDIAAVLVGTPTPTPTQVKTQLRRLDPSAGIFNNVDSTAVADIPDLKPTISNVFELGYKATIAQKLRIEIAGWKERRENFVGPLLVESPNVFLDLATTGNYLGTTFAPALVQRLVTKYGMSVQQASAIAAGITPTIAGGMAGLSGSRTAPGVPLGTVVPNDTTLTAAPDVFLTYRNFGEVDLLGLDLSVTYLIGNHWSLAGAYSHVNKDFFTRDEVGTEDGKPAPTDIALNAPRNKGALSVQYAAGRDGLAAELRGRYVAGFPINSGVYVTPLNEDGTRDKINCRIQATVDTQEDCGYAVFDATGSYRFKGGFLVSLSISNIFNRSYQTFAGLPYLGRLVQTRLSYTF
jgi:iron complex outermembrane receptor protein